MSATSLPNPTDVGNIYPARVLSISPVSNATTCTMLQNPTLAYVPLQFLGPEQPMNIIDNSREVSKRKRHPSPSGSCLDDAGEPKVGRHPRKIQKLEGCTPMLLDELPQEPNHEVDAWKAAFEWKHREMERALLVIEHLQLQMSEKNAEHSEYIRSYDYPESSQNESGLRHDVPSGWVAERELQSVNLGRQEHQIGRGKEHITRAPCTLIDAFGCIAGGGSMAKSFQFERGPDEVINSSLSSQFADDDMNTTKSAEDLVLRPLTPAPSSLASSMTLAQNYTAANSQRFGAHLNSPLESIEEHITGDFDDVQYSTPCMDCAQTLSLGERLARVERGLDRLQRQFRSQIMY